jgi:hypothetical protein
VEVSTGSTLTLRFVVLHVVGIEFLSVHELVDALHRDARLHDECRREENAEHRENGNLISVENSRVMKLINTQSTRQREQDANH